MTWSQVWDLDINSSPGTGGCPDPGPHRVGPYCWKKVAAAILVETRLGKLCPPPHLWVKGGHLDLLWFSINRMWVGVCLSASDCARLCLCDISWISPYLTESHHIWLNLTISHRILQILTKYQISPYLIKSQNLSKSHHISPYPTHGYAICWFKATGSGRPILFVDTLSPPRTIKYM